MSASAVGLVLAAGAGTRFGQPKAAVMIDGETLVDRAVRTMRSGGCADVFAVLGAWRGPVQDASIVYNPDWSSGLGSSLRSGLAALAGGSWQRCAVTLVDLPGLTSAAVTRTIAADGQLVVATYAGTWGHPVVIARPHWSLVADDPARDAGARKYLREHVDLVVTIEVGDVAEDLDVDSPGDLARWLASITQET